MTKKENEKKGFQSTYHQNHPPARAGQSPHLPPNLLPLHGPKPPKPLNTSAQPVRPLDDNVTVVDALLAPDPRFPDVGLAQE